VPPTYLAQRRYTFRSTRAHGVGSIRYVGVQGVGMLVASLSTSLASTVASWAALPAFLFSAGAAASVTHFLQKFWVFRVANSASVRDARTPLQSRAIFFPYLLQNEQSDT